MSKFAFPKKKWSEPEANPKGKSEIPEDLLQGFAEDYMEADRIKHYRFSDKMWTGLRIATSGNFSWLYLMFQKAFGGKMPDCLIYETISDRYGLMFPLELKTQDKNKKAVGRLHGKQKTYAKNDKWTIARSPEQIESELKRWSNDVDKMRDIFETFGTVENLWHFVKKHL